MGCRETPGICLRACRGLEGGLRFSSERTIVCGLLGFLSLYIWGLDPDSAGLQLHSLCRAVYSDLPVRRKGLMLHLRAGLEMSSFLCQLPNIPSFPSATKTGSKEHAERRHLRVILNNRGGGADKKLS